MSARPDPLRDLFEVTSPADLIGTSLGPDREANGEPDGWPDTPIEPGPNQPESLPVDALPSILRAHVESVAANLQVPADLPMLLGLGTLSAALAGKVEVSVRSGWREPVGIYSASILPPASRKSPTFAAMTAPVQEWEADAVARAAPRVRAGLDLVEVAERRLETAKRASAKGDGSPDELEAVRIELDRARAKVPPDGRLLAGDITPEAMVMRMHAQGGRLAILEPEPGPLQVLAGRYSDTPRLDELKKAWSAESLLVDRVGRDAIRVRRPSLTLSLCLQPGVLEALQNRDAFRVEGALGRILWCQPPHGLGERLTGSSVPPLDEVAKERYSCLVRTLLELPSRGAEEDGSPLPHVLRVAPDAVDVLHAYEAEVERDLGDTGRFAGIRDWAGKSPGQSVRVAALLELAARAGTGVSPVDGPIGRGSMESAVRILRALSTHALYVLGGIGVDSRTTLLRYVLDRVHAMDEGSTLRDLFERVKGKKAIGNMDDLRDLVDDLIERGCLRLVHTPRVGPGQPSSPAVELHPKLRKSIRNIRRTPVGLPSEGNSANSANVARRWERSESSGRDTSPTGPVDPPEPAGLDRTRGAS